VRFFGGWNYKQSDLDAPDMASRGYAGGVPMGGELGQRGGRKAPVFMVAASRDPDGANLDRIQVVKGWLDKRGEVRERIYDVALSDGRKTRRGRSTKAVGSTVDLATATYSNSIGAAQLRTLWQDPDFDPKQRAFYYVRVLEIPTPAWQAYDTLRFGDEFPDSVKMEIQDRAYTSPIWYSPGS